jgi:hypothetical protein
MMGDLPANAIAVRGQGVSIAGRSRLKEATCGKRRFDAFA